MFLDLGIFYFYTTPQTTMTISVPVIKTSGEAGAVLYTPFSLFPRFIDSVGDPFVQNLLDTVYPKPYKLGS